MSKQYPDDLKPCPFLWWGSKNKSFFLIKIFIPLQILLAGLRVTGEIDWNWRIVFLPLALYVFFNNRYISNSIGGGKFKKKGQMIQVSFLLSAAPKI